MADVIDLSRYVVYADMGAAQPKPCPYCKMRWVHLHNCLEIMNRVRTPTSDWWKI